jgi:hypothetical protein
MIPGTGIKTAFIDWFSSFFLFFKGNDDGDDEMMNYMYI